MSTATTRLAFLLTSASLLTACSDSDPRPAPQEFKATLTGMHAVKKGSNESLPLESLPAESATITLDH